MESPLIDGSIRPHALTLDGFFKRRCPSGGECRSSGAKIRKTTSFGYFDRVAATKIVLRRKRVFVVFVTTIVTVTQTTCFLLRFWVKALAQHTNPGRHFVTKTPTTKGL
jgi:hypothetical protein